MDFIKNIWSKITGSLSGIGQYLGLIKQVKTLKDTFPGVDDENKLRTWIITQADNFEPYALKTDNQVDDKLVDWVRNIAMNERAFKAVYNLVMLACEKITPERYQPDRPVL